MIFEWQLFVAFVAGSIGTIIAGYILLRRWINDQREIGKSLIEIARKDAEVSAREIHANAKAEFEQYRATQEDALRHRENVVREQEQTLEYQKIKISSDLEEAEKRLASLDRLEQSARDREAELHRQIQLYRSQMQRLTELSEEDIRENLRAEVRRECANELLRLREDILGEGEQEVREEARRILIDTIQRLSTTTVDSLGATTVTIPGEEMKGRIIGREGRNIRAFENATGTTLMIDDSPDTVLISSFDPVRRETARLALEELIADGRIHPISIEEAVKRASESVRREVILYGETAVRHLHLEDVPADVIELVGRLHFRLSNNQNTLAHSIEVGALAGMIAAELGLNPLPAKRAGLFHDCGKAIDEEYEGSHAIAGARLLRQHGEDEMVVNAVAAHHEEVPGISAYAAIVMIADRISATRPGARSDTLEGYIRRIESLESIARANPGVTDAYAVQAGREVRIIVAPDKIDDEGARRLARGIRRQIEEELQYPGTIRITVIRESRFCETAK